MKRKQKYVTDVIHHNKATLSLWKEENDDGEYSWKIIIFYFGAFNVARLFMCLEILLLMIIFLVRLRTVFRNSMFDYSRKFYRLIECSIGLLIVVGIAFVSESVNCVFINY